LSDKNLLHEKMRNARINAVAGLVVVVLGVVLLHWALEYSGFRLAMEILVVMGLVGAILTVIGLSTTLSCYAQVSLCMRQLEEQSKCTRLEPDS